MENPHRRKSESTPPTSQIRRKALAPGVAVTARVSHTIRGSRVTLREEVTRLG